MLWPFLYSRMLEHGRWAKGFSNILCGAITLAVLAIILIPPKRVIDLMSWLLRSPRVQSTIFLDIVVKRQDCRDYTGRHCCERRHFHGQLNRSHNDNENCRVPRESRGVLIHWGSDSNVR